MLTINWIYAIFIIISVVSLVLGFYYDYHDVNPKGELPVEKRRKLIERNRHRANLCGIFSMVAVCLAAGVLIFWNTYNFKGEYKHVDTMKIIALQDNTNSSITGNRYSIRSEDNVRVCYEQPDNSKKILKFPTDKVTFYEGDFTPRVERWSFTYDNNFVQRSKKPSDHLYRIYIPKGAIIEDFKIDLK